MRWIFKKLSTGRGGLEKWGNLCNFFFDVECQVYTNIQAISTLVCLLFDDVFMMCNYSIFYNICYKKCTPEKWYFQSLQSLLLPQFSTYRHRTRFIVKRKQVRITNYLGIPINYYFFYIFLKLFILPKK